MAGGSIQQSADVFGTRACVIATRADNGDINMHQVINQVVGLRTDADVLHQLSADFRVGPESPGPPPPPM
jgi:hypothetical protein